MSAQSFAEMDVNKVVDESRDQFFRLSELKEKLEVLKPASQFFLDPKSSLYIREDERGNIENYLNQLQSLLDTLTRTRSESVEEYAQNKANWIQQFNANYNELINRLISPYLAFSASQQPSTQRLKEVEKLLQETEKDSQALKQRLAAESDAAAQSARQTVGRYFDAILDDGRRVWKVAKGLRFYMAQRGNYRFPTLKRKGYRKFGINGGLDYARRRWLVSSASLLIIAAALVIWILKRHFDGNLTSLSTDQLYRRLLAAVPKILALLVVLLPLRFSIKNYNAASHLRVIYKHKSIAIRTLEGYVANMDASSQDEVRKLVAAEIFETPTTGYISTKEGAGSSEIPLEYWLGKIPGN